MNRKILTQLEEIRTLTKKYSETKKEIKEKGIDSANKLMKALDARLSIYIPIIEELGINVFVKIKEYTSDGQSSNLILTSDTIDNTWELKFKNYNMLLNKGIKATHSYYYDIFCVENKIIQELNFEELAKKVEEYILSKQKNIIDRLSTDIYKNQESLDSFEQLSKNNVMATLNYLFKLKNEFKDNGSLDLINPIIEAIDSIEDQIAEELD
jgi:hypothetical protein